MSETTPEVQPETEPQQQPESASLGKPGETPEQTIEGLRSALAKANAEAKDNRLKAAELDQLKQAQMSELEKAQTAAAEAQKQLAELTKTNLRNSVAIEKGVPADLVDFLTGDSREDIVAKADVLLARINAPTTPKPDLSQGGKGTPAKGSTADQFAAAVDGLFQH